MSKMWTSEQAPLRIFSPRDHPRIAPPPTAKSKHRRWAKKEPLPVAAAKILRTAGPRESACAVHWGLAC
jgi:hypothetical protein